MAWLARLVGPSPRLTLMSRERNGILIVLPMRNRFVSKLSFIRALDSILGLRGIIQALINLRAAESVSIRSMGSPTGEGFTNIGHLVLIKRGRAKTIGGIIS